MILCSMVLLNHYVIMLMYVLHGQNAKRVDLENIAVKPVSVRMGAAVTTLLGDASAHGCISLLQ